jgi:signal transduction histidine kinase/CheY-like chemotaxis protein
MLAENQAAGVLELYFVERAHAFSHDERAASQHLANQIAAALRLLEQQTMREKLFRSEKLAATGQLITGVAAELGEPLAAISAGSAALLGGELDAESKRRLQTIAREAQHAAGIVSRLVSFARADRGQPQRVDLEALLGGLIDFRQRDGLGRGVHFVRQFGGGPLSVLGSQGQLEQVFLNLLVHAEQTVAGAAEKTIYVATSRMAGSALVEIRYTDGPARESGADPFEEERSAEAGALGLGLCRGIIHSHGGEIRMVHGPQGELRIEVELPLEEPKQAPEGAGPGARSPVRQLTLLMVDPDVGFCRRLTALVAAAGHRSVPVKSAEEGVDLIERFRFDMVLCSVRLPGLNWVEFYEKVSHKVRTFVLLTEGYDADLSRAFAEGEGYILTKPVDPAELNDVLAAAESRVTTGGS